MSTRLFRILGPALLFALSTSAICRAQANDPTAHDYVEAIWHVQQLQFQFRSQSTSYACDALENKIANILRAVGARDDVAVDSGCHSRQFISGALVNVTLATPLVASEENVRRAVAYDSRDELVARLQRAQLPSATDLERFPASWERVSLTRNRLVRLDSGDCDLLSAMSQQLFPKLSIRMDESELRCSATSTRIRPRFSVAALLRSVAQPVAYAGR